ncbi:MAG: TetR/AcrR family transcriptional regulator [Candidatus Azobacteroides sp.]|nr:TetR/AcrR family transcriptional regulator [Candidatus Azobacteroides sp.]
MKYSREYILKSAFDVFMDKGYDSTSISVLQQELGMSRGALYRYFTNKEELFNSVVEEYFFKPFDKLARELNEDKEQTLAQLIETSYEKQKTLVNTIAQIAVHETAFLNYTALIIQAAKHYPDFIPYFTKFKKDIRKAWKLAILNSIKAKEIRDDIDVDIIAGLFNSMSTDEPSTQDVNETEFSRNIVNSYRKKKIVMDYLYSLIKT